MTKEELIKEVISEGYSKEDIPVLINAYFKGKLKNVSKNLSILFRQNEDLLDKIQEDVNFSFFSILRNDTEGAPNEVKRAFNEIVKYFSSYERSKPRKGTGFYGNPICLCFKVLNGEYLFKKYYNPKYEECHVSEIFNILIKEARAKYPDYTFFIPCYDGNSVNSIMDFMKDLIEDNYKIR
jgi:hypothetical protein